MRVNNGGQHVVGHGPCVLCCHDKRVKVTIAYEDVSDDYVRGMFGAFHKLMRTGIDDDKRDIKFAWAVNTNTVHYQ